MEMYYIVRCLHVERVGLTQLRPKLIMRTGYTATYNFYMHQRSRKLKENWITDKIN